MASAATSTSGRRRLPPAERKAQLLETALEVFARRGFGRAGHAEIAEAAGVAVSTVFLYFKTSEALVEAVLEEVGRLYLAVAMEIHAQEKPCRQILLEHRHAFHESLVTHPHHARLALGWSTAMREELWPSHIAFTEKLVENHVRTIRRGQEEGEFGGRSRPRAQRAHAHRQRPDDGPDEAHGRRPRAGRPHRRDDHRRGPGKARLRLLIGARIRSPSHDPGDPP